ncbi:MAG: HAD family hydrolase [Paracoccaceae bacterium]|nr:HAD family hydrolase [Paracoccaceae bacterium]
MTGKAVAAQNAGQNGGQNAGQNAGQNGGAGIGLVIFDCDGVLIDSEMLSAEVMITELAAVGVTIDFAHVRQHFLGRSFPTVAQSIRDSFRVSLPVDFEARYRANLLTRFETELQPTPGIRRVLETLTLPKCVATSSSPPRVARSLAIVGLDRYFKGAVFTASMVSRGKPAPDLFLHVAAVMGVPPARCLVIEDSRPGILAAQAAAMPVLVYTGGKHLQGRAPDLEIPAPAFDNWADFPHLMQSLHPDGAAL